MIEEYNLDDVLAVIKREMGPYLEILRKFLHFFLCKHSTAKIHLSNEQYKSLLLSYPYFFYSYSVFKHFASVKYSSRQSRKVFYLVMLTAELFDNASFNCTHFKVGKFQLSCIYSTTMLIIFRTFSLQFLKEILSSTSVPYSLITSLIRA